MRRPVFRIGLTCILILCILIPFSSALGEDGAYQSIGLVSIGLAFFLVYFASKIDFGIIKVGNKAVPMVRFFIMLIAGWVAVGAAAIPIGIIEILTPADDRLMGATNAIYTGITYTMIMFTLAYGILFIYWVFMLFKDFGGKFR